MLTTFPSEDLNAPEATADPYGYYGWLRENDPVHWNPEAKVWIVTRHDDVVSLVRDHGQFSSVIPQISADILPPLSETDWNLANYMNATWRPFIDHDRPDHLKMRETVHRWFTPRAVAKWRSELSDSARRMIEQHREAGKIELRKDFALPLPLATISFMLGIPKSDAIHLHEIAAPIVAIVGSDPDRVRKATRNWLELQDYLKPLIEERRHDKSKEDLIALFAEGEREGAFTPDQCLASVAHLLLAGHETTLNLICNGTLAFMRNPDQWSLLQSDPAALCGPATEECLRFDPPLKGLHRLCMEDMELDGKTIRAGERVFWVISAANRDPRVFNDPDTFDITRSPNPHVAFGGGIHHCLGAALARVEAQEAFSALVELIPGLQLDETEISYVPNLVVREMASLNLSWDNRS